MDVRLDTLRNVVVDYRINVLDVQPPDNHQNNNNNKRG